jgi:hypothetical protein
MMISKSEYMLFMKQPAWLWLKKNDPKKLPPVDENTQALFDAGHQFEPYAEAQFPEGLTLGFSDYSEYLSLPQRTQDAIKSGASVLFQPRFEWQDFTCICDVVSFVGDNEVDLYEIKASTSAKVEHEFDLAFQTAVLEGTGLIVRKIYVIHVNNQYVRNGAIEADKIAITEDVTDKVRKRSDATAKYMPLALAVAQQKTMPDPSPDLAKLGSKKSWLQVYEAIVPQEPKVYPEDVGPTIQHEEIKKFLDGLKYPIYFLDYETLMSLVPYFDGHRPYQQVTFQYSLHKLDSPDAELEWFEYLHRDNSDPARPLTKQLIDDIGDNGTVLVWYEGFEKARNTELGNMFPEHKEAMEAINDRIIDLMVPFKSKIYDDPRFEGSASIKQVLPVLCPELSYKDLGIQEGGSAQRLWMEAVLDDKRADQKEQILADLLEYCKLDTLAMVEIYKRLVAVL